MNKKKQDLSVCYLKEIDFRLKDTCRMKVKRWKNIYRTNGNKKKSWLAIFIFNKDHLKQRQQQETKRTLHDVKGNNQTT